MGKPILKVSGYFPKVVDGLALDFGDNYYIDYEDMEELDRDIRQEVPRTAAYSREHSFEEFTKHWLAKDRSKSFTQGDFVADNIGQPIIQQQTYHPDNLGKIKAKFPNEDKSWDKVYSGIRNVGFAFIDNKGKHCGLTICYQSEAPELFNITLIRHTTADPKDKEVLMFQGTDMELFQDLSEIGGSLYDEDNLVDQDSLKKSLLEIVDLPNEVRLFLHDVINQNGQLNVKGIEQYGNYLKSKSTNDDIFIDFTVYQLFCQNATLYLNKLMEKAEISKQQQYRALIEQLEKTEQNIMHALSLEHTDESVDSHTLFDKHRIIQSEIINFLKQVDISKPYQDLLEEFDEQYQYTHQDLWERRKGSLMTSAAFSVLLIAGIALTATGVMAPLGLAVIVAVNIVLSLAALVSWGLTVDKEINYASDKKSLKKDLPRSIQRAALTKGFSESTLNLYVKHAKNLDDTPAARLSVEEVTFFKTHAKRKDDHQRQPQHRNSLSHH